MTPYIAPDGRYLIFSRYDPKNSSTIRLYISYAEDNGGWTQSALIAKIRYGLCPVVTPDGKYLLFLSSPQTVSWMNTEFIEALRPSVQKPSEVSETP
jgi:Tol biopolymer transport system component